MQQQSPGGADDKIAENSSVNNLRRIMKLKKTTWGLLITAIILGAAVYYYESQMQPQKEAVANQDKKIFDIEEKDIKSLSIKTEKQTLKFEKTQDANQPWQMKQPQNKVANDAVISFLTNLLATSEIEQTFTASKTQKQEYGLDNPLATVEFELENNQKHQIILGKNTGFEGESIYAQIDPQAQKTDAITVSLIPKSFQYALERKPEDWILSESKEASSDTNQVPKPNQKPE